MSHLNAILSARRDFYTDLEHDRLPSQPNECSQDGLSTSAEAKHGRTRVAAQKAELKILRKKSPKH